MRVAVAARVLVVALVSGLALIVAPAGARADTVCWYDDATQQEICQVVAGGDGGNSGTPGTAGNRSNHTPSCYRTDVYPPGLVGRVPCTSADGVWVQSRQCYSKLEDPQPDASLGVWEGHKPGDGAIYVCTFQAPLFYVKGFYWSKTAPVVPVDPEVVAEQIVRQMALRKVTIGLAPTPGPGHLGLVGIPVYMWVADPAPQTIGPLTRSATSGGVTVTATAKVTKLLWAMGDGHSVSCAGPGTPYQDSFGYRPSPTCGYKYDHTSAGRPGDAYPVSATSYWRVTWAGAGQTGWFEFSFTTTTAIRVGEAQVLVTKPNQ